MNALVHMCKKSDDIWECHGPYSCIGHGPTIEEAEHDLDQQIAQMRQEIERWTGHRLSLGERTYAC